MRREARMIENKRKRKGEKVIGRGQEGEKEREKERGNES